MAVKKCRTWWFVQRIDNLPRDWEKILEDLLIPGAYIVHDRDTKLDGRASLRCPSCALYPDL